MAVGARSLWKQTHIGVVARLGEEYRRRRHTDGHKSKFAPAERKQRPLWITGITRLSAA